MSKRKKIPVDVSVAVLTEAGYRCAVPTCRNILAIDLHHMVEVSDGGKDTPENLIALCPTCHALYHRKTIRKESIRAWKLILVSLSNAFDSPTIDQLLFLYSQKSDPVFVSGDGVLGFHRLIASGLASYRLVSHNGPLYSYAISLTSRGDELVSAWKKGALPSFFSTDTIDD